MDALGRGPSADDGEAIAQMLSEAGPGVHFQDLIQRLVELDAFQMRRGEEER